MWYVINKKTGEVLESSTTYRGAINVEKIFKFQGKNYTEIIYRNK